MSNNIIFIVRVVVIVIVIITSFITSGFFQLLNMAEPPIITEGPPKQMYYAKGNRVVLQCKALASPPPEFEWFCDGEKLQNSNDQTFFHADTSNYSSVLHLSTKSLSGDYTLQCFASNIYGVAMSNITILSQAFLEETTNTRAIQNQTSTEGRPLLLPCNHVISNPPASRTWFTVDLLSRKPSSSAELVRMGGGSVTMDGRGGLVFTSLSLEDVESSRVYKCDAYNFVLRKTIAGCYYRVSVLKDPYNNMHAPDLIFSSSKVQSTVGNNVTLICIFSGRPVPKVSWQRLDMIRISGSISDSGRRLTIQKVTNEDGGMYRCVASNEVGQTTTVINLSVGEPPKLLSPMRDQFVAVGSSAFLTCNCSGSPDPVFDWFFNSQPLIDANLSWTNSGETLEIRGLTVVTVATITCNASNSHGYVLESARLYVHEASLVDPTQMTLEMTSPTIDQSEKIDSLEFNSSSLQMPFNFSVAMMPNTTSELYPSEVKYYGYRAHNYDFSKTEQSTNNNLREPTVSYLNIFNIIWLFVLVSVVLILIAFLYVRSRDKRMSYQVNEPVGEWRYAKKEKEHYSDASEQQGDDRTTDQVKQSTLNHSADHICYL